MEMYIVHLCMLCHVACISMYCKFWLLLSAAHDYFIFYWVMFSHSHHILFLLLSCLDEYLLKYLFACSSISNIFQFYIAKNIWWDWWINNCGKLSTFMSALSQWVGMYNARWCFSYMCSTLYSMFQIIYFPLQKVLNQTKPKQWWRESCWTVSKMCYTDEYVSLTVYGRHIVNTSYWTRQQLVTSNWGLSIPKIFALLEELVLVKE